MSRLAPIRLRDVLQQYERLWETDAETYARALSRLWDSIRYGSQDEAAGAHIGAQINPREHPRSDLILACPATREAVERGFAYYNRSNPHSEYALERRETGSALLVRHHRHLGTIRHDTENRLALLAGLVRWFDPQDRPPLLVRLRAPRPEYDAALQAVFGCPVTYSQEEDAVIFPDAALEMQIWGSEYVAQRCRDLNEVPGEAVRHPATLRERVAAAIGEDLSRGGGRMKRVAGAFGVSPRTLQRWLTDASLSYWDILEEVRFERCLQLLQVREMPARELAGLLGFSNSSNFHRAICRWFAPQASAPAAGDGPHRFAAAIPRRFPATEPVPLAGASHTLASGARKVRSPSEAWIAAFGPLTCPFASAKCVAKCAINPAYPQLHSMCS